MSATTLVIWHIQDNTGKPIGGALLSSVGGPGPWQMQANACGDAQTSLTPAAYTVTISATGFQDRVLPATIQDCGVITVGLDRAASVLPAPPTRDQLCGVKCSFQGLTVVTQQFGALPWFEPALGWLALLSDRNAVYDAKAAAGDTHVNLAVSSAYNEAGQVYAAIPGRDFSQDLGDLRSLIAEAICAGVSRGVPNGFRILLAMAGDGMSVNSNPQPGEYNDPVGMTYGYQWLVANFLRIWSTLRGDSGEGPDLTPWIVPMPGYDGVVPAWQPFACVNQYVQMARSVVGPSAALAIELAAGYNSWSGEDNDWATADGKMFDVILSEFPYPMGPPSLIPPDLLDGRNWKPMPPLTNEQRAPFDQVWQIAGALISPFNRPADMPENDYPGGVPYRLSGGTPRGAFYYIAFEYDTYGWVRGLPLSTVQEHRAYLSSIGCQFIG